MATGDPARARKLLLVSWDGADWGRLSPLVDLGALPALDALIARGTMARLSGLGPSLSPMVWTSIATGKRGDKHGVLDSTEPDEATGLLGPVSAHARQTSALWEILDREGLSAHAVAWPASDPAWASATRGVVVSDRFALAPNPPGEPWPIEPGSVHPERLAAILADCRIHPGELCAEQIRALVPGLDGIETGRDHRPAAVAGIVAEAATVQAAATWVLESGPWDFLAVHFAVPGQLADKFLGYAPPRAPDVAERDGEMYGGVVSAGYRFLDLMLARLIELAGEDATVIVVSDRGQSSPATGIEAGSGAIRGRGGRGFLVAAGPGIRRDELIHGAGPLDVAPTVLALFGLPVGADMDGRPLLGVWEEPPRVGSIPSWDDRVARPGPAAPADPDPDGALAELLVQGYEIGPPAWLPDLIRRSRWVRNYNLAMVHLDARRAASAIPILEALHAEEPGNAVVRLYLAYGLALEGDHGRARALLEGIGEDHEDRPLRALVEAMALIAEGKADEAVDRLGRAAGTHREIPEIHALIGDAYRRVGRLVEAALAFERAIAIDPDCAQGHEGLARCHLDRGRWADAADEALSAVGLDHHRADAHFLLGVALARMGRLDPADRAFATALAVRPGWPAALDARIALRGPRRRAPVAPRS